MLGKAGFFKAITIIFLFIAIGFCAYYIYQNFPREAIQLKTIQIKEPSINNSIPSKQFYDNMRYQDRIINYNIAESCAENKKSLMEEAFRIIESKTILSFKTVSKPNSVLNILCADIAPEAGEENHFVAGEGGPSKVLNVTLYSVILEGKIALYREGSCNNANVPLHELLHALGFDHNNNKKSILYPILECDQEIDEEIINSINKLYKIDSLPELKFDAVSATKSGRYLNFHMEVSNQGLIQADNVIVNLYAEENFVESFDLKTIGIGAKKIIDVENLKVPLGAKSIKLVIDNDDEIREIYEDNNEIVLNT
ncbi:MAG: CARDB domain-containing protein [Nanoarchaeota archaeon]